MKIPPKDDHAVSLKPIFRRSQSNSSDAHERTNQEWGEKQLEMLVGSIHPGFFLVISVTSCHIFCIVVSRVVAFAREISNVVPESLKAQLTEMTSTDNQVGISDSSNISTK